MRPPDTEIREALRAAGITIGSRGRISAEQYAEYDRLAQGPQAAPGAPDDDWPTADLDAPDPGNLRLPPPGPGPGNLGLPPEPPAARAAVDAEQTPRQVPTGPSAGQRARGLLGRVRASGQGPKDEPPPKAKGRARAKPAAKGRAKAEQPWRPTAGLIENIWSRMAMSTGAIPPLQRILAAQAPMSGVVLSAQLRGSLVDRLLLQPAARMEERADAISALVGVPAMVTLITMTGKVKMAPGPGGQLYPMMREDGQPDWEPSTEMQIAGLKFCLMSWLAVTERHAGDIIAQAEATVRKGKDADEIIRWIFAPGPPQSWTDVQREAAGQTMRAAGFAGPGPDPAAGYPAGGQSAPAPGFYGPAAPGPPPSTAFLPAIAGSVLPA
jgi:hypothetical protein